MPIENLNRKRYHANKKNTKLNINQYLFIGISLSVPINQSHNFFKDS